VTYRSSNSKRLPEKYYARRRVAAAVALLVVVALVIWGLVAWGGSRDDGGAESTTQTTSPMAAPAAEGSEDELAPDEGDEETEETPTSNEPVPEDEELPASPYPEAEDEDTAEPESDACELQDLKITANSDQPTYAAGDLPTFYMTVENPTGADCEIDLDDQTLRFEVYDLATNERIWSDTDCYDAIESGEETFESESSRYFEAVWSGTVSAPGQCTDRPEVSGGGYFLHAVVGGNPSPAYTFNLTG
jgi:hypothetical protein